MRMGKSLKSAEEFFSAFNADVARVTGSLPPGSLVLDCGRTRCSLDVPVYAHCRGHRPRAGRQSRGRRDNRCRRRARAAFGGQGRRRARLAHSPRARRGCPGAIGEIGRVLKPGGQTLHLFPCRYSRFRNVARLLPFDSALRITHFLLPSTRGVVEFQTHYDHCHPRAIGAPLPAAGFRTVRVRHAARSQTDYFGFLLPAFLLVAAYQTLTRLRRRRTLDAYAVVTAER